MIPAGNFNPQTLRGTPRAVGSLAGLTPARSWRDDLLALLAERRSLVEVRDWATVRGVHYRDEVLPLLEEWTEQGLLKTTGEAKEKRVWATKPGEPLPEVEESAPCRLQVVMGRPLALDDMPPGMRAAIEQLSPGTTEVQRVPDGAPIGVVVSSQDPRVAPVDQRPVRQRLPVAVREVDTAVLTVLAQSPDPMRPADVRAALADRFSRTEVMAASKRLQHHKRINVRGATHAVRWELAGGRYPKAIFEKPKTAAPALKPAAPPVEKTSLPQAEERKPCAGKCHRDTKPVNSSGELVAIVLIGPREDVLPRLRAALKMIAKRDGE